MVVVTAAGHPISPGAPKMVVAAALLTLLLAGAILAAAQCMVVEAVEQASALIRQMLRTVAALLEYRVLLFLVGVALVALLVPMVSMGYAAAEGAEALAIPAEPVSQAAAAALREEVVAGEALALTTVVLAELVGPGK